jgi:hypothetical protein
MLIEVNKFGIDLASVKRDFSQNCTSQSECECEYECCAKPGKKRNPAAPYHHCVCRCRQNEAVNLALEQARLRPLGSFTLLALWKGIYSGKLSFYAASSSSHAFQVGQDLQ